MYMYVSQVGFMFHICRYGRLPIACIKATSDNSNLLGNSKKFELSGVLKQITGNKKILSKLTGRVLRDID